MNRRLLVIVVAQLFGTSLWFSASAAAADLSRVWGLGPREVGYLAMAVQAGFICGTTAAALTGLADRYRASRIFCAASLAGALANAGFALASRGLGDGLAFRFATGVALAGIYPLGMKLVVSWTPERRGAALGWLVGTLTLGTATPHLVRAVGSGASWQAVVLVSSGLAVVGALMIARLGDGPHLPASAPRGAVRVEPGDPAAAGGGAAPRAPGDSTTAPRGGSALAAFALPDVRAAALGYFGHMWELYAFWTLVPLMAAALAARSGWSPAETALASFAVIAVGAVGCVGGGWLSGRVGSARIAAVALAASGLMCAAFPLLGGLAPALVLALLLVWGVAVVADSPQFSALVAAAAPTNAVGGVLALQNGVGFLVTIVSINIVTTFWPQLGWNVAWILLPGPVLGVLAMRRLVRARP